MYLKSIFSLVILVSLLFGCSNDKNDFKLIASEKSLPANFHEIAFVRESPPKFQYLVKKATNQSEYKEKHGISLALKIKCP